MDLQPYFVCDLWLASSRQRWSIGVMMTVWRIRWKTGTVLRCIVYDSVLSDRPTCTCTHTHTHTHTEGWPAVLTCDCWFRFTFYEFLHLFSSLRSVCACVRISLCVSVFVYVMFCVLLCIWTIFWLLWHRLIAGKIHLWNNLLCKTVNVAHRTTVSY